MPSVLSIPRCQPEERHSSTIRLEDAKATGFRPCKRCNPDGASLDAENAALVAKACRLIEHSEEDPSLDDLARAVDLSPRLLPSPVQSNHRPHPQRLCRCAPRNTGPGGSGAGNSVTAAIYEAGFNSSGRFYEKSTDMLGMTPTHYRSGGVNEDIRFAVGECSLGAILVASSKKGIVAILIGEDPDELVRELQDRFRRQSLFGADRDYEPLVARSSASSKHPGWPGPAARYSRHGLPTAGLARPPDIPAGGTVSYAELARRIGSPKAVRAVAGACAANNIAVAIPCHRVVRNDGSLSGYAWGVERKRALIAKEARP